MRSSACLSFVASEKCLVDRITAYKPCRQVCSKLKHLHIDQFHHRCHASQVLRAIMLKVGFTAFQNKSDATEFRR